MNISTRNSLLSALLRATPYTGPSTVYVSLHTSDGTELIGGAYARQPVVFAAPNDGQVSTLDDVTFEGMPSATVAQVGLCAAASGGSPFWLEPVTDPKTFGEGDSAQFRAGSLVAKID